LYRYCFLVGNSITQQSTIIVAIGCSSDYFYAVLNWLIVVCELLVLRGDWLCQWYANGWWWWCINSYLSQYCI